MNSIKDDIGLGDDILENDNPYPNKATQGQKESTTITKQADKTNKSKEDKKNKAEKNAMTDGIAAIVAAVLALLSFGLPFSCFGLFLSIRGAMKETKYRGLCIFGIVICGLEFLIMLINAMK